ncbi:hypothetical protein DSO57_1003725 [Entomophthora muscae]|uniref:Uncharacterized protein n=1 Tax=Entomophthora muscae TaxID=34485 RepID=A0ACC2SXJ7_9FUNG|nr:hypothetical protein DSO57_1003725 [Entomophthora muscae]
MLLGQNQTSLYCVGKGTSLFCPPINIPQFGGSHRRSLASDFTDEIQPPIAKQIPYNHTYHRKNYTDEYHWLRDDKRNNTEVIDYLKAENQYSAALLSPLKSLEDKIYNEIIGRMTEDDVTYPKTKGDYGYYEKTVKGLQYPIRCRKRIEEGSSANEEVLLDLNLFKEELLGLGEFEVSPNQTLLAYTLDTTGSEIYSLFIKDLEKRTTSEELKEMTGEIIWSNDGQHMYYTTNDELFRSYRLFRHKLGNQQSSDELLYEEKD